MGALAFSLVNGRQTIDKDPNDIFYYGVNLVDVLTAANATIATDSQAVALGLAPLSAAPAGVEIMGAAFSQGTYAIVKAKGGVAADGQSGNYVRFRVPLTTGEQIDRTIYFNIAEA